jgi:tetratricopeptide (TPR) repeat protein
MNILPSISLLVISALVLFSLLQEGGTTHPAQMIIRLLIVTWLGIVLAAGIRAEAASRSCADDAVRRAGVCRTGSGGDHLFALRSSEPSVVDCDRGVRGVVLFTRLVCRAVGAYSQAERRDRADGRGRSRLGHHARFGMECLETHRHVLQSQFSCRISHGGLDDSVQRCHLWLSTGPGMFAAVDVSRSVVDGLGTALGGMFLAVLLTQSRGGMVVFLAGSIFVLTVRYRWKLAGGCVAVVVLLGLVVPTPIRDRVLAEHQQNPVSYARWQMWQGAVAQMVDHPLGIGLGLYQYTFPLYAFPVDGEISRFGKVAQTPHNDYLQMGVEMGPGAILVFGIGIVLLLRELRQVLQSRLRRWQRSLIVGAGGGAIALLIHAMLDSSLRESALATLLVLCGALIVSAARLAQRRTDNVSVIPIHSRWAWGIGAACLVLVAGAEVTRMGVAWMKFDRASRQAMAGETDAAIEGLKTAVALDPGKALYHHGLGSVYARAFEASRDKQAFQLAYAEFKRAIELNPLDSRLLGLLGQLYVSAAQVSAAPAASDDQQNVWLRAAVQVYERAIGLAPFSAMYRYEQARLYWMLGERSDAERRAAEAENLEPNFLPARALLARLWIEKGQVDQARGQLREILARQARYKEWSKTSLDQAFLNVDVAPLRAAIGEKAVAG